MNIENNPSHPTLYSKYLIPAVTLIALSSLVLSILAYLHYLPIGSTGLIAFSATAGGLGLLDLALIINKYFKSNQDLPSNVTSMSKTDLEPKVDPKKTDFLSMLLHFYGPEKAAVLANQNGKPVEDATRTLDNILSWDDEAKERRHDYIQWLFPLDTRSVPNPISPVLDSVTIQKLREPEIQENAKRAFKSMMKFYGFSYDEASGTLTHQDNATTRILAWTKPSWGSDNHNFLRITRILKSLEFFGLQQEKEALWKKLNELAADESNPTISNLLNKPLNSFWRGAFSFSWNPS